MSLKLRDMNMPAVQQCPTPDHFERAARGELPPADLENLASHVEVCSHCVATLPAWLACDTLAAGLSSAGASAQEPAWMVEMLTRLKRLSMADSTEGTAGAESIAGPRGDDDSLDFLSPPQSADEIGRLGQYRILRILGRGGMGLVFEAQDARLERKVALKVLRPRLAANAAARERFLREARAVAALDHDNVVPIYEVGEVESVPFLAMPLLTGMPLDALLAERGPLPIGEVLSIGRQVCAALAFAHGRGVVHRDIKPSNLWHEVRGEDASSWRIKVLDFGLARATDGLDPHLTASDAIVGTPSYMAPEQAKGAQVDARADLFSVGAVLYELATGRKAFDGPNTLAVLSSLAVDRPAEPISLRPEMPAELSNLIVRLLDKDPSKRPAAAQEAHSSIVRIERALIGMAALEPSPARGRGKWLIAAAVLLAIVLPLGWLYGGPVVRYVTNQGLLVVEVNDPQIEVRVVQDGLVVRDWTTEREFTLKAGNGTIEVSEKDGVKLATRQFSLTRGDSVTVTVTFEKLADSQGGGDAEGDSADPSGDTPAGTPVRQFAELVLKLGGELELRGGEGTRLRRGDPLPSKPFGIYWILLPSPNRTSLDAFLESSQPVSAGPTLLAIGGLSLSDDDVARLAASPGFASLGFLDLNGPNLTAECLPHLAALTDLHYLAFDGPPVDDEWLARIGGLSRLQTLGVPNASITADGLAQIANLPLHGLNLHQCDRLGDADLIWLASLKSLRVLTLQGVPIGDAGVEHLLGMKTLEELWLGETRLTGMGAAKLSALPRLTRLGLDHTAIGDDSVDSLGNLTGLTELNVRETRLTAQGVERLRELLPSCRIDSEHAATP